MVFGVILITNRSLPERLSESSGVRDGVALSGGRESLGIRVVRSRPESKALILDDSTLIMANSDAGRLSSRGVKNEIINGIDSLNIYH